MATPNTMPMEMSEESFLVSGSDLTRIEVLKRRMHFVKTLKKIYRDYYWLLMEDVKSQFREYYWEYGISPFLEEGNNKVNKHLTACSDDTEAVDANEHTNNGGASGHCPRSKCEVQGCKSKAMALTPFCHMHILSDPDQKLYKPCNYPIKSCPSGHIRCRKPILRSSVPSYCTQHLNVAEKHVSRALKKAGLNITSASKFAPKFHEVIAKYVSVIKNKRRAVLKAKMEKDDEKDDISI